MFAGKGGVGRDLSAAAAAALEAAARWSQRVLLLSRGSRSLPRGRAGRVTGPRFGHGPRARRVARVRRAAPCGTGGGSRASWAPRTDRSGVAATFDRALARDPLEGSAARTRRAVRADGGRGSPGASGRKDYDLVVLDSAPTGHALRLLACPRSPRAGSRRCCGGARVEPPAGGLAGGGPAGRRAGTAPPARAARGSGEAAVVVKWRRRALAPRDAPAGEGLRAGNARVRPPRQRPAHRDLRRLPRAARWQSSRSRAEASWDHAETAGARRCWRFRHGASGRCAAGRRWTPLPHDARGQRERTSTACSSAGRARSRASPAGLPGLGPPRALPVSEACGCWRRRHRSRAYGAEPIERGLRDLDWVSACDAELGDRVAWHFLGQGTLLPMKLFTLFTSDEAAVAQSQRDARRIARVLRPAARTRPSGACRLRRRETKRPPPGRGARRAADASSCSGRRGRAACSGRAVRRRARADRAYKALAEAGGRVSAQGAAGPRPAACSSTR